MPTLSHLETATIAASFHLVMPWAVLKSAYFYFSESAGDWTERSLQHFRFCSGQLCMAGLDRRVKLLH
jgi:hypothetical protein